MTFVVNNIKRCVQTTIEALWSRPWTSGRYYKKFHTILRSRWAHNIEQLGIVLGKDMYLSTNKLESYMHQCTTFRQHVYRNKRFMLEIVLLLRTRSCAWMLHWRNFQELQSLWPFCTRCTFAQGRIRRVSWGAWRTWNVYPRWITKLSCEMFLTWCLHEMHISNKTSNKTPLLLIKAGTNLIK